MSKPEFEAAEVVAEHLAAEEVENEKVGFDIDELPLQHILLFLPWIQSEPPKKRMLNLYDDLFEMTNEKADEVIDSMAFKDGDEHVKDIFKAYHKPFLKSGNLMAKRMLFGDIDPGAFKVYKKEYLENSQKPDIFPKLAAMLPIIEIADNLKKHVTDQKYKEIAQDAKEKYQKNSLAAMWFARCEFL
uniref:Uncharacterized protein n=1 Tax=Panagrolaimus davidi TaxID=227884 RepID=A0A914Q3R4_9BILA